MRGAKGWVLHCPLLQVCWGLSPQSWHPCHPCHDLASLPSLPSLLGPTTAAGAGLGVSFVLLWSLMCTPRAAGTGGSLGGSSQLPMRRLKPQTCNRAVLALLVVYNFLTLLKGLAVPEQLCGDSELRDRHWWQCGWRCDPTEHPVGFSKPPKPPPWREHGCHIPNTASPALIQGKGENQSQAAWEGTRSLSAGFMALSWRAQSSARAARVPPQPTEKFLTY